MKFLLVFLLLAGPAWAQLSGGGSGGGTVKSAISTTLTALLFASTALAVFEQAIARAA